MYTTYNKSSNPMSRSPETDLSYVYSFSNTAVTYGPSSERKNRKQNTYKRRCTACISKELEIEHKKRDYQRLQNTVTKRLRSNEQKVKHLSSGIIKELEKEKSSLREKLHEVEEDRDRLRDALWDLDLNSTQREETTQSLIDNLHEEYGKALEYISELKNSIQRKTEDDENQRWRMKDMEEKYEYMEQQFKCKDDIVKTLEMNLYEEQSESDRLRITCVQNAERIDNLQKSLEKTVAEKEYLKHELESVKNGLAFTGIKNRENEIARLQEKILLSEEAYWRKDEECKKVEKENRNLLEKLKNFEFPIEAERQIKQSSEYNNSSRKSEGDIARLQNQLHTLEVEHNLVLQENRNLQRKLDPRATKDTCMYQLEMKNTPQNEELCNQIKRLEDKIKAMDQEKADLALMHSSSDKQKEDEILTAKDELRKVEIEIESLKSSLQYAEEKMKEVEAMETNVQQLQNENKQLKVELSKTKMEDTSSQLLSKHKETTEAQLRNLKAENQTFQAYISMLVKENENAKAKYGETHAEKQLLQENLNQLQTKNRNLQEENARSRKKMLNEQQQLQTSSRNKFQQLEDRIAELVGENSQLQVNMSKLSKEKDDTVKRQVEVEQKLMAANQNMQEKLDSLSAEKRLLEEETAASASKKLSETDQQLKVMATKVRQLEGKVTQLSSENTQLHRDIAEVSKEKENALTRLSKVAGAKLTHGNAAITDLSDTNRPTKIAEKFSELYDNQWTDAFEELDNTYNNEEETIQVLLKILKEAYDFCERTETNYETRIGQAVFTLADVNSRETRQITGADVGVQKSLSDLRLSLGNACCLIVEEMFLTRLHSILKKVDVSVSPKTKLYARQCASLCWRMRIRDPPVFVRFEFRQGTEFNTDILRRYTKTGGYLDFIVWPALYLHEKGPVLSKGVAQPKHAP